MADDVTSDGDDDLPCYTLLRHSFFYSFSDKFLSAVRENQNNNDVEVNDGGELDTNSASIFDCYFDDDEVALYGKLSCHHSVEINKWSRSIGQVSTELVCVYQIDMLTYTAVIERTQLHYIITEWMNGLL